MEKEKLDVKLDMLLEKPKYIQLEELKRLVTTEIVKFDVDESRIFINIHIKNKFNLNEDETKILVEELEKAEEKEKLYKELIEDNEVIKINASQDYSEREGINYTFLSKNSKFIVTSKRNIFRFEECLDKGIQLKEIGISESKLSPKTVVEFARNGKRVKISDIYLKIRNILNRYIFFENENLYSVVAIWIIHTYVYQIFLYVPYLWLNGDKGSGKSMILTLIGKLAFNAFPAVSVTEATLFRQVDREESVLLLDEYERASAGIGEAITQILNSGFYKEIAKVPRNVKTKDSDYEVKVFSTFSPKVISGISEISDVLADRAIKIKTKKIGQDIKIEKFSPTMEMENTFRSIVNDLYLFGLTYGEKVYEIYHSEKLPKIDKISVREADIWKPLLTISNIIDDELNMQVSQELINYAIELNEEKRRINLENNISYKLINILDEFLESGAKPSELKDRTKVGYGIQRVFEFIKGTEEFEDIKTPQHLSKLLNNNLDIKSERVYDLLGNRLRIYLFDKNVIEDLKNRYNLKTTE